MDILEILKSRRSIRKYEAKPIPEHLIEAIVDCARLAPSAINIQPWEFIIVREPEKKRSIALQTDYGRFIKDAPVLIAVFCVETMYFLEDGCSATVNLLNAAWALGLGTCWVAGDKKPYARNVARLLGVPEGHRLISLIALGYPAEQPGTHLYKKSLKDILHWEGYRKG
ncbi:MAG TPA: nitroreductase family protein [Atribacteraceae bacterium]|nr:nitroreductase family protein [Atribacteraceae bacterium]